MTMIWISVIILLILIELMTNKFVMIWFALSGIISLLFSIFINNYIIQFLIFIIFGLLFLLILRDKFINIIYKYNKKNINKLIGKIAIVTKEINKDTFGEVKVFKKKIKATSLKNLKKGDLVRIINVKDCVVKVEKLKLKKG